MSNTQKPDKRFFKTTLAALLTASVLAVTAFAGCSGGESGGTASPDSADTEVVTRVVDGVYTDESGVPLTDPNGSFIPASSAPATTAKQTTSATDSKQASASSKAESSKTDSSSKPQSSKAESSKAESSKAESSKAESSKTDSSGRKPTPSDAKDAVTKSTTQADSSAKNLTIGGKTFNVGDKVTCTYYLMVPNVMLNFQGVVNYDATMLKKTGTHLVSPASNSAIINPNLEGRVVFNGSDLSGYDFTSPGYDFLVVEFEVLKTGSTEPSITFEVITDTSDKSYCDGNGALSNGAKMWAVYE